MTRSKDATRGWRRRRWIKRLVIFVLVFPFVLVVALWLSQGWWLPALVEPAVEKLTGFSSTSQSMRLGWNGEVAIRRLQMRPSGRSGTPTVVVARLDARLSWSKLLRGIVELRGVTLVDPVVRIGVDSPVVVEGDAANIATPSANKSKSNGFVLPLFEALPEIEIINGTIAFTQPQGEKNHERDEIIFAISGAGALRHRAPESALYDLSLQQVGPGEPIRLTGWVDLAERTASLSTQDISLTHWIDLATIPQDAKLWRSIVSAGRVKTAELSYAAKTGVSSRMEIDQVGFSVPMLGADSGAAGRLIFQNVSGVVTATGQSLHANLTGSVEGLPTTVTLSSTGLSLTSPFEVGMRGGPFLLGNGWKPLQMAPQDVLDIVDDFSAPTAKVTTQIVLSRQRQVSAVDEGISISGKVVLEHGAATFVDFPYPLSELAGVVRFDDQSIRIEGLTGVGPTGAVVRADGVVTPAPNGVGLELDLQGHDFPIDDVLLDALDAEDRSLVNSLLDQTQTSKLQTQGVFATRKKQEITFQEITRLKDSLSKADRAGDADRSATLRGAILAKERIAARPTFDLGGVASFSAHVSRPPGPTEKPHTTVNMHMDNVGIVYEDFPYPVIVSPLEAHIAEGGFEIVAAPFQGLSGAQGEVAGGILASDGGSRPDIAVHLNAMPIDETLLAALSLVESTNKPIEIARSESAPIQTDSGSMVGTLRRLGAKGVIAGDVRVSTDESGEVLWDVFAPLTGLAMQPGGSDAEAPSLDSFAGALTVSQWGWRIRDGSALFDQSLISFSIDAPFEEVQATRISFASEALELSTPVELVLQALGSDAAESLADVRKKYDPRGVIAARGQTVLSGGANRSHVELTPKGEISIAPGGVRSRLAPRAGRAMIDDGVVTIEDARIELLDANGASQGMVTGSITPTDQTGQSRGRIEATNLAFESPLTQWIVEQDRPEVSAKWATSMPVGRFDIALTGSRAASASWRLDLGELRPRSLRFTVDDQRVAFDSIQGVVTLGQAGGRVRGLELRSPDYSATLDGSWFGGETPGVDLRFVAHGDQLGDDLVAIMPADVRRTLRGMDLKIAKGFRVADGKLAINAPVQGADVGEGFRDGAHFSADVSFQNASANIGVHLENMTGKASINATRAPAVQETNVDVSLAIDRLVAEDLSVHNVTASIRTDPNQPRTVQIATQGDSHGGRVTGLGEIHYVDGSTTGADGYTLSLEASGLDLTGVLNGVGAENEGGVEESAGQQGRLDASITLAGELDSSSGPHGAGALRIVGGQYATLPLVMSVLEFGKLIPPVGERLDYARAEFTLSGDSMIFNQLLAVSPSMALTGDGSMKLADGALDLRFGVSGNHRLPIFSSMYDALRNELMTTHVTGTLREPTFRLEPLSKTRRFIVRLLGGAKNKNGPSTRKVPPLPIAPASANPD